MDSPLLIGVAVLAAALLTCLLLVPLGLPGLWLMLGAAFVYHLVVAGSGIGPATLLGATAAVVVAEVLEFWLGGRYAQKYGGSRRASWGAVLGGIAGALVGVPVPVVGSVIASLVGAFAGAFIGEATVARHERGNMTRVATGAVIGRAVAAAAKTGIGVVVAVWLLAAALLFRG